MMKKCGLILGLLLLPCLAGAAESDTRPAPAVGRIVTDFQMFDLVGHSHSLSDYHEPVIVLNFWAFWCDTWRKQLGQLKELATQQEALGFRLLVISVDGQWTDARRQVLHGQDLPFPVLLDADKLVSGRLGIRRVPTVLVLDRRRQVQYVHEAYPGTLRVLRAIRSAASLPPPNPD
jgi:cytochrome c biogenesis protein CcmG, thiol:disulfide interchange protein DsbE